MELNIMPFTGKMIAGSSQLLAQRPRRDRMGEG
jgi:hypothetical protein